ncbi:hypothetical protein JYU34_008105 [Plutella xylostella]|uniref:Uncharacterized protein n=1 Tax=Plutella xylostella TaxID=51655 RepID=A0ABQ7QNS3_PLUXY|nr:hypothetical protein JYU34_008105 [Plutella xylostella]
MDSVFPNKFQAPPRLKENKMISRDDNMKTRNLLLEKSCLKRNKEMNSIRASNPAGLMPYSGDSTRPKGPYNNEKGPFRTNQYVEAHPMPDTEEALLEYLYKIKSERDENMAATKKLEQRKHIREKYTFNLRNAESNNANRERKIYGNHASNNNNKDPVSNNNACTARDGLGNNSYPTVKPKRAVVCRMPRFDNSNGQVSKEMRNDGAVRKTITSEKISRRETLQSKLDNKDIANSEHKKPSVVKYEVPCAQCAQPKYQKISKCSQTNKHVDVKSKVSKRMGGKLRGKIDHRQTSDPPETEVAKWEPSCINRQTKPYYEAWVDKTLTAFYKTKKDDEIDRAKRNILENYQRKLILGKEFENQIKNKDLKDEKFVGKIRVKR